MSLRSRWKSLPRLVRWPAWLLFSVGLYALLLGVVAPRVARDQVPPLMESMFPLRMSLGEIHLNPFRLDLSVHDVSITDTDGNPALAADELYVDLELASAWTGKVILAALRLDAPDVHLVIAPDGAVNLADLFTPLEPTPEEEEPVDEEEGGAPTVEIADLRITGGSFAMRDETVPTPFDFQLTPINIELRDFTTAVEQEGPYNFTASNDRGETLEWTGQIGIDPLRSAGTIGLRQIRLHTGWSYVRDSLRFEVGDGTLDFSTEYTLDGSGDAVVLAMTGGKATVTDLHIKNTANGREPIVVPSIVLEGLAVDTAEQTVSIDSIRSPKGRIDVALRPDNVVTLAELFEPVEAPPVKAPAKKKAAPKPEVTSVDEAKSGDAKADGAESGDAKSGDAKADQAKSDDAKSDKAATDKPADADKPKDAAKPAAKPAESAPWVVTLASLALEDWSVAFRDETLATPFEVSLEPLTVKVTDVTTVAGKPLGLDVTTTIGEAAKLTIKGKLTPTPTALDLDLTLGDLPLSMVQPYVSASSGVVLRQGTLGAQLSIAQAAAKGEVAEPLEIGGTATVSGLDVALAGEEERVIGLEGLGITGLAVKLAAAATDVGIAEVALTAPDVVIDVAADGSVNLARAATPPVAPTPKVSAESVAGEKADESVDAEAVAPAAGTAAAKPTDAEASAGAPVNVRIEKLRIDRGRIAVTERGVTPPYKTSLEELAGELAPVGTDPSIRTAVDLACKLDGSAPITIKGQITPQNYAKDAALALTARNISLRGFSPYSGRYVGYNIDKGKLTINLDYTLKDRGIVGDNEFIVDQLEFGRKVDSPEATSLPVPLAISLLKDGKGRIDIEAPVRGNIDDPSFSVMSSVMDELVGILTKAVTAPFNLLGDLTGLSAKELKRIEFEPGSAVIEARETKALGALAEVLQKKEGLTLEVQGRAHPYYDRRALAEADMAEAAAALDDLTPEEFTALGDGDRAELYDELYRKTCGEDDDDALMWLASQDADHNKRVNRLAFDSNKAPAPDEELSGDDYRARRRAAVFERLRTDWPVDDQRLEDLAEARARNVEKWMQQEGGISEERLFLRTPDIDASARDGKIRNPLSLGTGR